MTDKALDQAIEELVRHSGVPRQEATAMLLEFLGNVDDMMVDGIDPTEVFTQKFGIDSDYLIDILFS